MECREIDIILGLKALPYRDNKLGLVPRLMAVKEHAITHRDVCILSSLMVRGILVIS